MLTPKESRRLVRGGEARRRISPWSLLLKDDASKRGRVTGVIPSACSLQARGAVFRKERGKKSGTAECFKRFVSELRDKAFFIFRKGDVK